MSELSGNEPFSDALIEAMRSDELGGKARGLYELKEMGYQVPEFIVVPFHVNDSDVDIWEDVEAFATSNSTVAVRSSANIEDGIHSSFAGQFDSYLNVTTAELFTRINNVRDSVFSEHVREYCNAMSLSVDDIKMNVIIQNFNEPSAGGVWMGNGITGGRLEWTEGRGDAVVDGSVKPHFESYDDNGSLITENTDLVLVDHEGKSVAEVCKEIQSKLGYDVDLEFCITEEGIQWLQLRRVTKSIGEQMNLDILKDDERTITGEAASPYTASGISYRLDQKRGAEWGTGKILIARATSPADMMFIMTAEGVVTRMGGMLSHSAVVCRELGKACVVGVDIEKIAHDSKVTIDGKIGKVALS